MNTQTSHTPSNIPSLTNLPSLTAINRGQDYCKSSNNIALVPANGTFELTKILSQASRCLRSIMPVGRKLIIHPLPTDLCTTVISDSHWLLENVLCLVSNAIKYSDSGDVDLRIHISTDIRVVEDSVDVATAQHSTKSSDTSQTRVVESDHMLVVTITDHGVGVSEEMRETLFQPFRQAQRMAGGTGDTHPSSHKDHCLIPPSLSSNTILFLLPLINRTWAV